MFAILTKWFYPKVQKIKIMKLGLPSLLSVNFRWLQGDFDYFYDRLLSVGLVLITLITGIGLAYIQVNISPIVAALGVFAIPLGILMTIRPNIGLWIVVFALPLEEFNKFGGSLSLIKILSIVVFGTTILHFLIFRRRDSLVNISQNWLIGLFVFFVGLSNLVAIDSSRTLDGTLKLLRVLSLYFVVINVVLTEKELNRLLWAFLLGGLLSTVYGLLDPAQQGQRMVGTLGQTNLYALSMVPRISVTLCLLGLEKKLFKKVVLWLILGLITYGLLLTGSRGGLLALITALFLFIITQKNRVTWLVIVAVIVVVSLIVMPLEMKQRVGLVEASSGQDLGNSTVRRETYQIYGLQLWQQHPILGIGIDGFAEAYTVSDYRFLQKDNTTRVAHNTYLEILVGTGILGLGSFMILLWVSLLKSWEYSKLKSDYPYLAIVAAGLLSAQGGYFLGMLFGSRQFEKTLWLLIALVVVVQNIANMPNVKAKE